MLGVGPAGFQNGKEKVMTSFRKFLRDENGATAIEYGLIAALLSVVIIAAVTLVGTSLEAVFTNVGANLSNAVK